MAALHALRGRVGAKNSSAFDKPSPSALGGRDARQQWIAEQLEERKRQRFKGDDEKRQEVEQRRQQLWSPYVRQVARTHELNIAWKHDLDFFSWDRVLALEDLEALRITGHRLATLPDTFASMLSALTVLSLIANGLEELPENIGDLRMLSEIDLTKNKLRRLPDSLTTLPYLTHLNLSSNLLEELPQDFGALVLLDKLWFENNKLAALPKSIGSCRARIANFNANLLTALPDTIGEMQSLTTLSLNMNQLREFPDSLCSLPRLESLHASQNQITQLPHNIGSLQTLRELRLDWNLITQLPFSFRLLKQLKTLCMERNPLKLPPIEYIVKGVPATMVFIERSLEEFVRNTRRKIVERLQEILTFAMTLVAASSDSEESESQASQQPRCDKDVNTILSLFEPNCERIAPTGGEKLAFFAVVWEEFYSTLLPILERKKAEKDNEHPSFRFDTFTVDEVDDALQKYDDDFGVASIRDSAEFRKCSCIDTAEWKLHGVRKRKVCIPGQVPYRCRRDALFVRMQMMTHEEAKDQLASTYLKNKIARLELKTKRKCIEYINSETGVAHFEALALEFAKSLFQKRKRLKKLRRKHEKETQTFATKKQKLQAKIDAFRRARDARLKELRTKLEKLENDRTKFESENSNAVDKKRAEKMIAKIQKLEAELTLEPAEDAKILELEIALEVLGEAEMQAAAAVEKEKAKEMGESNVDDGTSDDGSSHESSDEGAESDDDDDSDSDNSEGSDSEDVDSQPDKDIQKQPAAATSSSDAASTGGTKFFQIDMPELKFVDYRRTATCAVERELGDEKEANEDELVALFQTHLRDAYVSDKCERVAKKATFEFLQMRAVLKRWMGLGNRAVFEAWRDLMRANREDAAKIREKLARKKLMEEQNREIEEQLARLEAHKWLQRIDMYTDAVYYEHSVTGETSWYPPAYWDDEQEQKQQDTSAANLKSKIPALRLPPI